MICDIIMYVYMVRRFLMENIDPRVHISTDVQSTDVGILSLLEHGWLYNQISLAGQPLHPRKEGLASLV